MPRAGAWGTIRGLNGRSLQARLAALLLAMAVLLGTVGLLALHGLSEAVDSVDTVYRDRVVPMQQLGAVGEAYGVLVVGAIERARDGTLAPSAALSQIEEAQTRISQQWRDYLSTYLVDDERLLIAEAAPAMRRADEAIHRAREMLLRQDLISLANFAAQDMYPAVEPVLQQVRSLQAVQPIVARAESQGVRATFRWTALASTALALLSLGTGGLLAASVVNRHLRDQQTANARAARMSRFYRALSRTSQLIVRERSPQALFEGICSVCVETGHARLALFMTREGDEVTRSAIVGPATDYFEGMPDVFDLSMPQVRTSLVGEALLSGMPTFTDDFPADPRATAALRTRALEHNVRSVAAFPVRRGGRVIGALGLYAEEVGFFDDPLMRLLEEMVGDVSLALDRLDSEAAHESARREVEAGLLRFGQLFHKAPISILIVSPETGVVRDANDFACTRYGIKREQLIGHRTTDFNIGLVEGDREAFYAAVRRDGHVDHMPGRLRGAGGEIRDVLVCAEQIDYLGEACIMAMSLDVTELRATEQARQAQAQAEEASRAKTEFLSRMSHELRTPLNAVLGFSQLLLADGSLSPDQAAQLGHVRHAGRHLLALINDVLDISRIEAGHLPIAAEAVKLDAPIDEALRMLQPLAQANAVTLTARQGVVEACVCADPVRLRQVLINLMSNAVKYNRPGGWVRVDVQAAGPRWTVRVSDNGIGMNEAQLAKLYEPFNRLGREHGSVEGSGIGMALTRQLVLLMGGELRVRSEPDKGTDVELLLPAADADAAVDRPEIASGAETPSGEPAGVLLYVEDNPVNLLLVEQMLQRWPSVRMVKAEDGRTGLDLARTLRPDVVLLDMHLPDLDGPEILRRLRADPATGGLVVVALSASAMADEVSAARAAGANDYWTKPFDVDQMLRDLRRLLPSTRSREEPTSLPLGLG